MKLLYYNWVQFDDPEGRSGGVRQYQANLISHLVETSDHEIVTVSSGTDYDKLRPHMRFETVPNVHGDRVQSFVFVNSPVMAPGHRAFGSGELLDETSLALWHDFLREHGPFDVVQFDSLEGIPFTWLRIHEIHPETRVLFYAHNYYSVCPQVNLWKNEEVACVDYRDGKDCVTCLPNPVDEGDVLRAYQISRLLRKMGVRPGSRSYRAVYALYEVTKVLGITNAMLRLIVRVARSLARAWAAIRGAALGVVRLGRPRNVSRPAVAAPLVVVDETQGVSSPTSLKKAPAFRDRRRHATMILNREADAVLATSNRTAEVLARYGIDPARIEVCYIGTRAAEEQYESRRRTSLADPERLTVAYLGYMRRDKGFKFLLDALDDAPAPLRERLRLVVAARRGNDDLFKDLEAVAQELNDVLHYDGYTHGELPEILDDVDIGIVPVQWEDNLPQVAIEMVAHGLPILTSDRGGAKELGGENPAFVFDASSPSALIERLEALANGSTPLSGYWEHAEQLWTMEMHTKRLMELYRADDAA